MASPPPLLRLLLTLLLFAPAASDLVLEDGYTVTTAADLNPRPPAPSSAGAHPYSLLPLQRSGDLLLLDSAGSALYTIPLPLAGEGGELRVLAGGGGSGFADGDPNAAAFNRPRSIAVDAVDNIYVADRANRAVRKVSPSGYTTTIAGGRSSGTGHRDGPAQNATFSPDFELVYVPKICALLVADRGNRLIRQINLKPEDCAHELQPGLGTISVSVIAVLCVLFGSVIGFLVRHFLPVHEVYINRYVSRTWKQYQMTMRKVALINFSDIKSVVASSMFYTLLMKLVRLTLGYLTIVFPSVRLERRAPCKQTVSLLDLDKTGSTPSVDLGNKSAASTVQLVDFISSDGDTNTEEDNEPTFDADWEMLFHSSQGSFKKIDHMIETNLSDFSRQEKYHGSTVNCSGISRRSLK